MIAYLLTQQVANAPHRDMVGNITRAFEHFDLPTWTIVLLIVFFSVGGWAVIFAKLFQFIRLKRQDRAFLRQFDQQGGNFTRIYDSALQYPESPCASIFAAGYTELRALAPVSGERVGLRREMLPSIQRAYERVIARQILNLESHMIILATAVSVCPFLGLLGTVWGLLDSFWGMGAAGTAHISAVAPGIAEALVTTVFGLVAAVPALVGYNGLQNRINEVVLEMDEFCGRNMSILERNVAAERSAAASRPTAAWSER